MWKRKLKGHLDAGTFVRQDVPYFTVNNILCVSPFLGTNGLMTPEHTRKGQGERPRGTWNQGRVFTLWSKSREKTVAGQRDDIERIRVS